jgi:DNA-binding SARP family transcriptional activator
VPGPTRIQLCGRLGVEIEGSQVERSLPGRQGRLLFAFLVLHRHRPVRRDELVQALWSEEGPPPSGDALLAPPLSRLRKALGPERIEGRGELCLHLPEDAWVDWEAARDRVDAARASESAGDPLAAAEAARGALDILQLGLLPGLEAGWIDERRVELEDRRVQALELLARACIAIGGPELATAEAAARAAVEAAPFRESTHSLLMEALRARGNVAEALRAFEGLRRLLREELGTPPGPALLAQHEQLLGLGSDDARRSAAPSPEAPEAPASLTPERVRPAGAEGHRRALPDRLAQALATPLAGAPGRARAPRARARGRPRG